MHLFYLESRQDSICEPMEYQCSIHSTSVHQVILKCVPTFFLSFWGKLPYRETSQRGDLVKRKALCAGIILRLRNKGYLKLSWIPSVHV